MVVDGLPMRQVTSYREQLAPDGLARFLERGAWFSDAQYGHAYTVTAAGHATMLTGAYPHRSGIIGNEWRDADSGEPVYNTGDTSASYIGHKTNKLDGTSPKNLRAETVGDVLRRLSPASKVISVSGKDRGAILPAGHAGTAYMYMSQSGGFASSTYYMASHPAWVEAFNAGRPADRYFMAEWKAVLPNAAYAASLPDDQPWYGKEGGHLPMVIGGAAGDTKPTPAFYSNLLRSPFADALTLDFARAAIAGEGLGQDDAPDILSISLSSHDYVNHQWSAESKLSHDHLLQLDRLFQMFFQYLDSTVGKDNYLAVLTADHGFMPAPETALAQGLDAGRLNGTQLTARVNAGLEQRFGVPKLSMGLSASGLLIDRKLVAERKLDANAVQEAARTLLQAEPGIAAAYTRRELEGNTRQGAPFFDQSVNTWNKDVSADVQFVVKPMWMFGATGATHGSPHRYDTHVPILLYGPNWVPAGRVDQRVEVVDIAPTLAGVLGVPVPSLSEGKLLPLPRR
jgi:predicted AlkP superfamily pyrophosphatase or phosphodiesterase